MNTNILGVVGYSGSGKKDLVGHFDRLDARVYVFDFDTLRDNAAQKPRHKKELKRLLGDKIFKRVGGAEVLDMNHLYTQPDVKILKAQELLMKDMEKEVFETVVRMKDKCDIFVVADYMLPLSGRIWNRCMRVYVDADEAQRHARLETRVGLSCDQNEAKKRDRLTRAAWKTRIENGESMTDSEVEMAIKSKCKVISNKGTYDEFKVLVYAFFENTMKLVPPWKKPKRGAVRKQREAVRGGADSGRVAGATKGARKV